MNKQLNTILAKTGVAILSDKLFLQQMITMMRALEDLSSFTASELFLKDTFKSFLDKLNLSEYNLKLLAELLSAIAVSYGIDMLTRKSEKFMDKLISFGVSEIAVNMLALTFPEQLQ